MAQALECHEGPYRAYNWLPSAEEPCYFIGSTIQRNVMCCLEKELRALCEQTWDEWRAANQPIPAPHLPLRVSVVAALPLVQVSSGPHEDGETVISN